ADDVNKEVEEGIRGAFMTRGVHESWAWSAVFVVSCIRSVAIDLGLEGESSEGHVGRNVLLKAHEGHRVYVREAYERKNGASPITGTYLAFRPEEAIVEVGDIVVQDRDACKDNPVVTYDEIPTKLANWRRLHADIVVEVTSSYAETIGGNLGHSDPV